MTITEISTMLDTAIKDVSIKKETLDKATAEHTRTVQAADKKYGEAAQQYDLVLEKVRSLRNQLNAELEKLSPSNPRVRGAADVTVTT